jgi:hypothetical protein
MAYMDKFLPTTVLAIGWSIAPGWSSALVASAVNASTTTDPGVAMVDQALVRPAGTPYVVPLFDAAFGSAGAPRSMDSQPHRLDSLARLDGSPWYP